MKGSRLGRVLATAIDPGTYLHPIRLLHFYGYSHVRPRRKLTLGKGVRLAPNVSIRNGDRITIGNGTHVGEHAYLWAGDDHGEIFIGERKIVTGGVDLVELVEVAPVRHPIDFGNSVADG